MDHRHDAITAARSARFVAAAVAGLTALFALVWLGSISLLVSVQDREAQDAARRMMQVSVADAEHSLRATASDYSRWDLALRRSIARDVPWLVENMAVTVDDEAFDLFALAYPEGTTLGWVEGAGMTPQRNVLPPKVIDDAAAAAAALPRDEPASFYIERGGEIWHLAAMHAQTWDGTGTAAERAAAPLLLYGRRIGGEVTALLAGRFLLEDGRILRGAAPDTAAVPLRGADGATLASIAWTPPRPGTAIRNGWAWLGALLAAAIVAGGVLAARYIRRMAIRLSVGLAADRAKSVLLANVSHELRTPLNGILGATQVLKDLPLDSDDRTLLEIIETSAENQLELINDLIELARLDAGEVHVEAAPVAVAALVEETALLLRTQAESKGLDLRVLLQAALPMIRSDRRLLRQILVNLGGNAIKFTDAGSVEIEAGWKPGSGGGGRGDLVLAVRDTGRGIAPEDQARIFERFVQSASAEGRAGSGLGLSITRALVDRLGGSIRVESEVGRGSTFSVTLPSQTAAEDAAGASPAKGTRAGLPDAITA